MANGRPAPAPWPIRHRDFNSTTDQIEELLTEFTAATTRFDVTGYKTEWARQFASATVIIFETKNAANKIVRTKAMVALLSAWAFFFTFPAPIKPEVIQYLGLITEFGLGTYAIFDMLRQSQKISRLALLARKLSSASVHLYVISNAGWLRGRAVPWSFE